MGPGWPIAGIGGSALVAVLCWVWKEGNLRVANTIQLHTLTPRCSCRWQLRSVRKHIRVCLASVCLRAVVVGAAAADSPWCIYRLQCSPRAASGKVQCDSLGCRQRASCVLFVLFIDCVIYTRARLCVILCGHLQLVCAVCICECVSFRQAG